jgi:hypothetical protein
MPKRQPLSRKRKAKNKVSGICRTLNNPKRQQLNYEDDNQRDLT